MQIIASKVMGPYEEFFFFFAKSHVQSNYTMLPPWETNRNIFI